MTPPTIEDAGRIARARNLDCTIVLGIDAQGRVYLATYGKTTDLCKAAAHLGDASQNFLDTLINNLSAVKAKS